MAGSLMKFTVKAKFRSHLSMKQQKNLLERFFNNNDLSSEKTILCDAIFNFFYE